MGLAPAEIITRRAFDDEVIRSMLPSPILDVEGFRTLEDVGAGRPATAKEGAAGRILYYAAWYTFPVLIGPGKTTDGVVAVFNANVPEFPHAGPLAHIASTPMPWSPHVRPEDGMICQGYGWQRANGRMLMAHAIVHVARLLNCDESDRGPEYGGYNRVAMTYWRETMRCRPLTAGLKYPVPSVEVTHGISSREPLPQFRVLDDDVDVDNAIGFQLVTPRDDAFQLIGGA